MSLAPVSKRWLVLAAALLLPACTTTGTPPGAAVARSPQAGEGIVSAADPRAAAAGVEILRKGGSATDAAIATMLVLNVVEPQNSGIGGGLFFVRTDRSGALTTVDGRETAPAAATPEWFLAPDGKPLPSRELQTGARSAGVPGALAAMASAHKRFGKLPWADLFAPAIRLANDGFTVSARMHNGLKLYGRHVTGWARQTYFPDGAQPVATGSTIRVPLFAQTLQRIAREGAAPFYRGGSAARIAGALSGAEQRPSPMTAQDIGSYRARDRQPICATYRVYRICGMGPPSSGGITVLMILKQLERFDMAGLGRNSPVAWHLLAESERLAYADRDMYLGDPDFVQVPVPGLLDPAYLASRSALIGEGQSLASIEPGKPKGAPERKRVAFKDDPGTTHLSAADAAGEVVTVTTTINGYFGSGIAVDGYMLNNELPDFDATPAKDGYLVANRVEGGKRPRSSMAPTIVYGPDGKVRLAIGAAGGSTIICQIAKALIGVLDWNMSAQDAIAMGLVFAPGSKGGVIEEGTELVAMLPQLQALGETLKVAPLGLKANAIEYVDGRWVGAADPRSEGVAMDTGGHVTVIKRRVNELNGAHE
ncbi:gamma-glutamyltranspeptidase/glutathione hydrolase [Novosphingobium chloroacetimidivorans]|uniref:Glutathione hydrolase proenzyme n=1 Tax=Novosphingobium chloroacetimidivorans TaxID=1428314 RepID=A0A7W7NWC3_9SPHN|nr:gamma-glutamyltransferase [Novosphingobium chloroacetimidivorans]MBB4858020.1 gamma-glutamyltranspeptidase/glutathione hydrolase [Novosphingobium chloroacetimidivorans]